MRTSSLYRTSLRLLTSTTLTSCCRNQAVSPFQCPTQLNQYRGLRVEAPKMGDLTYYTFGTPNGFKPAIVLEELGLQYKPVTIDITNNTQKEDWYLAINPNGRIPALKDGDLRVFESGAVMMYLTDKYDKDNKISYPNGTDLYYEMLSWLMWQMGGLGPMQGKLILSTFSKRQEHWADFMVSMQVKPITSEQWQELTRRTASSDIPMKPSDSWTCLSRDSPKPTGWQGTNTPLPTLQASRGPEASLSLSSTSMTGQVFPNGLRRLETDQLCRKD